jgi:hypothetical protein
MVKSEMMKILAVLTEVYPKFVVNEVKAQIFYELLGDLDYNILQTAVKKHMLLSEFPPTIAELRKQAVEISNPSLLMTAADAWGEIERAIRNHGSWNEIEAMKSMSDSTRKIAKYMGWQDICMSENIEVTRGQFFKMYGQVDTRQKTEALLPETLKADIQKLTANIGRPMLGGGE